MTTPIKTLACAAMVSMLLSSCNSTWFNTEDNNPNATKVKEVKQPPNDPAVVIIEDDVQKWIDEQLASNGNEKKIVLISDMYLPNIENIAELSATYSNGKTEYFLKGEKISAEEYNRIYEATRQATNTDKRNLSIPGVISEDSRVWTVLITAKEITELAKKYDNLAIYFYSEPVNEVVD